MGDTNLVNDADALHQLRIDPSGDLPIYLQLKYQLSYLITTEKLLPASRLPAVRNLAQHLGVNHHTVAQAYRALQNDGLIDSTVGRGSFVRRFSDLDRVNATRHELLNDALEQARHRARALGFSDQETIQRLTSITQRDDVPCHVVYVDRVPHIARKYARRLEHHMGRAVRVTPLTFDDIAAETEETKAALAEAFYVVTVARNVPWLEQQLPRFAPAHEVLTIVAEPLPSTVRMLAALDPSKSTVVLAEEHYLYSSLNLLSLYSSIDPNDAKAFTLDALDRFIGAAREADVILYTFGAGSALAELDLAAKGIEATCFELGFDIAQDSVAKLRTVFGGMGAAAEPSSVAAKRQATGGVLDIVS